MKFLDFLCAKLLNQPRELYTISNEYDVSWGSSPLQLFHNKIADPKGLLFYGYTKTHKKLVATVSRREGACNRTDKPSVTFCERGEARKRADDFLYKKVEAKLTFASTWCG